MLPPALLVANWRCHQIPDQEHASLLQATCASCALLCPRQNGCLIIQTLDKNLKIHQHHSSEWHLCSAGPLQGHRKVISWWCANPVHACGPIVQWLLSLHCQYQVVPFTTVFTAGHFPVLLHNLYLLSFYRWWEWSISLTSMAVVLGVLLLSFCHHATSAKTITGRPQPLAAMSCWQPHDTPLVHTSNTQKLLVRQFVVLCKSWRPPPSPSVWCVPSAAFNSSPVFVITLFFFLPVIPSSRGSHKWDSWFARCIDVSQQTWQFPNPLISKTTKSYFSLLVSSLQLQRASCCLPYSFTRESSAAC